MCETSDPDRSRSRSLPQVKCGVCHELLLRGQKEEHEKVCLGRVCRPLAAKNPAAAARAAAQARLAGFNGTREPKLAALRGGANKNGKDSADIVPPHKENAAPSHPVRATQASRAGRSRAQGCPRVEPAAQGAGAGAGAGAGFAGGFRQGPRPEGAPEEARRHGDAQAQSTQGVHR